MKKQLLFGLICGTMLSVHAQPVMENKVPPIGTTYNMNTITGLTDATDGADQTWTYGSAAITLLYPYTIIDPSTLPSKFKDSVPGATYAARLEIGAPDLTLCPFDFIEDKTTHYLKVGVKGSGSTPPQKKNDTIILFNQTFGSSVFYANYNHAYTGYGSLTIKAKTYSNVVKIKMYQTGGVDTVTQFYQFSPHFQLLLQFVKTGGNIQNSFYWEPSTTTGVSEVFKQNGFEIYPNPAMSKITIDFPLPNSTSISVFDMNGKLVKEETGEKTKTQVIDISDLHPGIYFVKSGTLNRKLIVQ